MPAPQKDVAAASALIWARAPAPSVTLTASASPRSGVALRSRSCGVTGNRRGHLRGHDKAACPKPFGKGAGQGDVSVAHGKLAALMRFRESAYMFCPRTAIGRFIAVFWTGNNCPARE